MQSSRLVNGLRASWWDEISIREIWTSPHLSVITSRLHTHAGSPWELRAAVVLISRQVSEGLAGYSLGSSPRDMRCCMAIRQTLSRADRDRETSSRGMMRPRHCRTTPGYDNTRERVLFYELRGTETSWKMTFTIWSRNSQGSSSLCIILYPPIRNSSQVK
jgi:hypothetical protein